MQTSNYLPYAIDKEFGKVTYRGPNSVRFFKRHAHKRARQSIKEYLFNVIHGRDREPSKHKFWVTAWDID